MSGPTELIILLTQFKVCSERSVTNPNKLRKVYDLFGGLFVGYLSILYQQHIN